MIRLNVVNEGGCESERLGWHSRFANENEGRREEVSLNDSAGIRDSRFANENEGRRAEVSLNDSAGIRDSRMRTRGGGRK